MVNINFTICKAHDCDSFTFGETTCRQPTVATGYGELVDETQYTSTLEIFDSSDELLHTFTDIVPSASEISYLKAVSEFSSDDLCGVYTFRYTVKDTEGEIVGYKDVVVVFDCPILCLAENYVKEMECGCADCYEKNAEALRTLTTNYNYGKILAGIGMVDEAQLAFDKAISGLGKKCKC